jgi:hypothetical protein
MTLEKIVIHATDEARKAWKESEKERREKEKAAKKSGCPSCEIQELKNKKDYDNGNDKGIE